jgi:hypothetical protein
MSASSISAFVSATWLLLLQLLSMLLWLLNVALHAADITRILSPVLMTTTNLLLLFYCYYVTIRLTSYQVVVYCPAVTVLLTQLK